MEELRSELISLGIGSVLGIAIDDERLFDRQGIFVGLVHSNDTLGADDLIFRDIDGSEAACETGQSFIGKPHRRGHRFLDLAESSLPIVGGECKNLDRFIPKQRARRIHAIDPDIPEGPSAESPLDPDIAGPDLERENRLKHSRLADSTLGDLLHSRHIGRVEVEPVSRHQLYIVARGRGDHVPAFAFGEGKWFFAQYMDSGSRGPDGVSFMEVVR